jgi:hypothetical protein
MKCDSIFTMFGTSPKTKASSTTSTSITHGKRSKLAPLTEQNMQDSPLLRLPGEIRNMVYNYTLPSGQYTIREQTSCSVIERFIARNSKTKPAPTPGEPGLVAEGHTINDLSLLLVCRQIHSETALIPFKQNVFCFANLDALIDIESIFTPKQCSAITNIQVNCRLDEMDLTVIEWYKDARPLSESLPNVKSVLLRTRTHKKACGPRWTWANIHKQMVLDNWLWLHRWGAFVGGEEVEYKSRHTVVVV